MTQRFIWQDHWKAVTLFSGLGSSSHALRSLGFNVTPHDFMPEAVQTLQANGFHSAQQIDVRQIDYQQPRYRGTSVLVGGPPCQPFSQSHDGSGQYDPRDMIPEFVRAVRELRPALFVMEEVPTLTWKKHAAYLKRVIGDLYASGYHVEHRVLNAADYGHAQARKRLFIVGIRDDIHETRQVIWGLPPLQWPNPEAYDRVTMAKRLGWDVFETYRRNQLAPEPARIPTPGDIRLVWPHARASTTVVGSFRPDVQAAPGYRKAGDGPRQNTPGSVVTTLQERLLLQDMPEDWVVCGSKAKQDLQVGNSVPSGLIRDLVLVNL